MPFFLPGLWNKNKKNLFVEVLKILMGNWGILVKKKKSKKTKCLITLSNLCLLKFCFNLSMTMGKKRNIKVTVHFLVWETVWVFKWVRKEIQIFHITF
jgi:hypothetical protein